MKKWKLLAGLTLLLLLLLSVTAQADSSSYGVVFGAAGGVSLNRGKLIVNNGIITSKGTGTTGDWGDGTGNQNAAAINVNAQYGSTSVEIKGGKITAEKDAILLTNGKDGTIKVSGQTLASGHNYYADTHGHLIKGEFVGSMNTESYYIYVESEDGTIVSDDNRVGFAINANSLFLKVHN